MRSLLQGFLIGLSIVLPGMSGGTVILILGLYEKSIRDLSRLNLKPYIIIGLGVLVGIFAGGQVFAQLFILYRDPTAAFFLGIILASIKALFRGRPTLNPARVFIVLGGLLLGFLLVQEPVFIMGKSEVLWPVLIVAGALSTATMLLPGVPGSAVLIVMGMYDDILFYLKEFLLVELLLFGAGSVVGILLFARVLEKVYFKHQVFFAFLFAGLIAGSSWAVFPTVWGLLEVLLFLAGFGLIWFWEGKERVNRSRDGEHGKN